MRAGARSSFRPVMFWLQHGSKFAAGTQPSVRVSYAAVDSAAWNPLSWEQYCA
jgi:hypothetical protein